MTTRTPSQTASLAFPESSWEGKENKKGNTSVHEGGQRGGTWNVPSLKGHLSLDLCCSGNRGSAPGGLGQAGPGHSEIRTSRTGLATWRAWSDRLSNGQMEQAGVSLASWALSGGQLERCLREKSIPGHRPQDLRQNRGLPTEALRVGWTI